MTVTLHLGIGYHDRGRALAEGKVQVPGLVLEVTRDEDDGGLHQRFLKGSFDACELSFAVSVRRVGPDKDFLAVPVFPARKFRHSFLYVRSDAGIDSPEQLAGRRVGINGWDNTAAVWTRAFLAHDYGVDLRSVEWVSRSPADGELSARLSAMGLHERPAEGEGKLADQLCLGALDALVSTTVIDDPRARRLFPDYRTVEREYYQRTGILPIGHLVAVRRSLLEAEPAVAGLLIDAWEQSKRLSEAYEAHPNVSNLLWFSSYQREERTLFGDPFPYGIEANRPSLEAFVDYAHEQGLTEQRPDVDSLFV